MNYRAKFFAMLTSIPLQQKRTERLVWRWRVSNACVLHAHSIVWEAWHKNEEEERGEKKHISLGRGPGLCAVWRVLPAGLPPAPCFFQSARVVQSA